MKKFINIRYFLTGIALIAVLFILIPQDFLFAACICADAPNPAADPNFDCSAERQGGIVPCGKRCNDPTTPENECCTCGLCHFFMMIERIVRFLLVNIVAPLAALMLAGGGVMLYLSQGDPGKTRNAKSAMTLAVTGIVVMFGAWLIVNTVFALIGVAAWTGLSGGWFRIDCAI